MQMKIPFIQFKDHPVLGNLTLDFRKNCEEPISVNRKDDPFKKDEKIYVPTPQKGNQYSIILNQDNIHDYVLFVGENGCGKTMILKEIYNYNNSEYIDYVYDKINVEYHSGFTDSKMFGYFGPFESIFLERDIKYNEGRSKIYRREVEMRDGVGGEMRSQLNINNLSEDGLKCFFENERLAEAYTMAQKFQIPHAMRAGTFAEMTGKPDTMIDYIKELSSGEQEILLRLLYFFKHPLSKSSDNVLIDEPETGLHPKWQLKILEYYKRIFHSQDEPHRTKIDEARMSPLSEKQKLQLFIASHSENILKSAIEQKDWLIIRLFRDKNGKIKSERVEHTDRRQPTISYAETQYIVFDIPSIDYHNELYGHLQNKTGKTMVKDFDSWIAKQNTYQKDIHEKQSPNAKGDLVYQTICSYIRNESHHPPEGGFTFSNEQLCNSIQLLRELCKTVA